MGESNVDVIREGSEAFFASGDTARLADHFVWDLTRFEGWPDKDLYSGIDEFREFIATWFQPFEEWRQEFERLEEVGDDRVLGILRQHARLKGATAEVELRYAIVYTVEAGRATRADVYMPAERALEAVGRVETAPEAT